MMLNGEDIRELFVSCLFNNEDIKDGKTPIEPLTVRGITFIAGFDPRKIDKNKDKIIELLDELNPEFKKGWTFLNLCYDKHGNQWTGMHNRCELLMMLGMAIGHIEYCCDREMWDALPGGMPYIIIK